MIVISDNRKLDLSTALSRIKQASEAQERPFFFIVGAGISYPEVKLAGQIEEHCKKVARRKGRNVAPASTDRIETYSHWFEQAYPDPEDRRAYLEKEIRGKPISHANLRLAHILAVGRVGNLVVTTNFDDFLLRALLLFGKQPFVYDQSEGFRRIDPELNEIQIAHVHGSYRFYDCRNLKEEILRQVGVQPGELSTVALSIDRFLQRRSPIIVGYSGWEGDVVMSALKTALGGTLRRNIYWFCHKASAIEILPDWLKGNPNVYFVVPSVDVALRNPLARNLTTRGTERSVIRSIESSDVSSIGPPTIGEVSEGARSLGRRLGERHLTAREVFDGFIQAFGFENPPLITDPLGYLLAHLTASLPKEGAADDFEDIYAIASTITRLKHAKAREDREAAQQIERQLGVVRAALRRSAYEEAIVRAKAIKIQRLTDEQRRELIYALSSAINYIQVGSQQEWDGYSLIIEVGTGLSSSLVDEGVRLAIADAFIGEGLTLVSKGANDQALEAFDEAIRYAGKTKNPNLRLARMKASINKGVVLTNQGRYSNATMYYDRVIRECQRTRHIPLKRALVRALFNKAVVLRKQNSDREALALYNRIVKSLLKVTDFDIQEIVAGALINKGVTHGLRSQKDQEIESYDKVIHLHGRSNYLSLRIEALKASLNKAIAFTRYGNLDDAIRTCEDIATGFGNLNDIYVQQFVSKALLVEGDAMMKAGRQRDAFRVFNRVITRYSMVTDAVLLESVAIALLKKGTYASNIQQATNAFDELIEHFGQVTRPPVAGASRRCFHQQSRKVDGSWGAYRCNQSLRRGCEAVWRCRVRWR